MNTHLTKTLVAALLLIGGFVATPALAASTPEVCASAEELAHGHGWDDCQEAVKETVSEVKTFISDGQYDASQNEELVDEINTLTKAIQELLQSLSELY